MLSKDQKENLDINTGGDFDPIPADKYTVQIVDVNLVSQFNKFKGIEQDVLNYQFAILDDKEIPNNVEGSEAQTTRGRFLWHRMSPSTGDRSWMGKMIKAVLGRDLTKDEKAEYKENPGKVEELVGKQITVMTEQSEGKDDRVYTNIISYMKAAEELEAVEFEPKDPSAVVEKSTTPATAPVTANDPDEFISGLEKAQAEGKKDAPSDDGKAASAKAEAEAAELEAKALEAKAKAARARANANK